MEIQGQLSHANPWVCNGSCASVFPIYGAVYTGVACASTGVVYNNRLYITIQVDVCFALLRLRKRPPEEGEHCRLPNSLSSRVSYCIKWLGAEVEEWEKNSRLRMLLWCMSISRRAPMTCGWSPDGWQPLTDERGCCWLWDKRRSFRRQEEKFQGKRGVLGGEERFQRQEEEFYMEKRIM